MLQLKHITKNYKIAKEVTVPALKDFSLNFRKSEFVSVLGPSGCGKTTLLNIIGGLDGFDGGEFLIDGQDVGGMTDRQIDAYRNNSVGFVFQNYNLIPHLNILQNVALTLSLKGESKRERTRKAAEALKSVGLGEHLKKRPRQLSGGQMQRVAIARAIVNDPDVILADEPTGALDSETGVQIAELLKTISKTKLVIMVTHNGELAQKYSTRIVNLLDGELVGDTNPYTDGQYAADSLPARAEDKPPKKQKLPKMPFFTTLGISLNSLWAKKWRAFWTCFAGSIGIFGIALILAISIGMGNYVDTMQAEAVGDSAIRLGESAYSLNRVLSVMEEVSGANDKPYPDTDSVIPFKRESFSSKSPLTEEFIDYIKAMDPSWIKAVNYTYDVKMHVLENLGPNAVVRSKWADYATQMIEEDDLISQNYSVLAKAENSATGYPQTMNEVSLVVDKFNRINPDILSAIGVPISRDAAGNYNKVLFGDIIGKEYSIVLNDGWYTKQSNGKFKAASKAEDYRAIKPENTIQVKIISVLRIKSNDATQWLDSGLVYLPELSEFLLDNAKNSEVGMAQLASTQADVTGGEFTVKIPGTPEEEEAQIRAQYITALKNLGAYTEPTNIKIYPVSISAKQNISAYIDAWNAAHKDSEVTYLDLTDLALTTLSTFIDIVTYVLIAFSAVALIVSTVMISVITYTSVVERTKEIGILRSIGARKKDIAGLFNGETILLGLLSWFLGMVFALSFGAALNAVLKKMLGVSSLVVFNWQIVLGMLGLSVALTLLAGLVPAVIAAKKRPVDCLRAE